jgi:CelD/BcsL family acetyltransferase involved in cellulose biosynthesis
VATVREINQIDELSGYGQAWQELLAQTPGATFFQSLEWLEAYWRHFGADQRLRVLVVLSDAGRPGGIVPLVIRREKTKVGRLRVLTYPLHDWGSFYGPVGPEGPLILTTALAHVQNTQRDWDVLELRWLSQNHLQYVAQPPSAVQNQPTQPRAAVPQTRYKIILTCSADAAQTAQAMREAGFQAYQTLWDHTAIVDLDTTWDAYFASRPRTWRRNYRAAEKKLAEQGEITFQRYRPGGAAQGDADPRWDLYDVCQNIAQQSWQAKAANGTTLSHESVKAFLREAHAAAAAAGAVDMNILWLDGKPLAFAYNYHWRGYVYGLRMGFDPGQSRAGAGTVLLGQSIRDSIARGDRIFDLGVGSAECKRHFQTATAGIFRCSHYPPIALRAQLLRLKRWCECKTTSPLPK